MKAKMNTQIFRYLFAAFILCNVAATEHPKKSATASNPWGTPIEGCELTAVTDKNTYPFPASVILHVIIRNKSKSERRFFGDGGMPYSIQIMGPDGKYAHLTRWGLSVSQSTVRGSASQLQLRSGQSRAFNLILSQFYDTTLPGTYVVTVVGAFRSPLDPNAVVTISSNTLNIKIIGPQGQPTWRAK